jgi:uncharacterized protein YecT (DUF1311 family)
MVFQKEFVLLYVNVDHFSAYAIITDKEANIRRILMLSYRKGNPHWQIEREVVKINRDGSFLLKEESRYPVYAGRDMLVVSRKYYRVRTLPSGEFDIKHLTTADLIKQSDKRLNELYRYLRKKLDKNESDHLRRTQRMWIKYIDLKCAENIGGVILDDDGMERLHKDICRYNAIKHRIDEFNWIINHASFR